jgi:hypothetical protein
VELTINRREIEELVESNASYNFLQMELSSELRLRIGSCGASVKVVVRVASIFHIQLDK